MGNCLSSGRDSLVENHALEAPVCDAPVKPAACGSCEDAIKKAAAVAAAAKAIAPSCASRSASQQVSTAVDEQTIELDCCNVANAVTNPDTSLILNMLDPVNGPASGLPYQVHYLGPPRPPCEEQRLATVMAVGKIQENKTDPEIQCILKLVGSIFKAPATLCALFDEKQVFISEQDGDVIPCGQFPWRWTLCGWSMAFKNPQVLVIQDTLLDARFRNNEKVTIFPKVRFYCGAPLIASNGHRLGTLCFADVKPRKFDQASCIMMNNLSELVVRQLEKNIALKLKERDNKVLAATYSHLQRTIDCFDHCVVLVDTSEEGWRVVYANASWQKLTGLDKEGLVGNLLSDVLESTSGTVLPSKQMVGQVAKSKNFEVPMARVKNPSVTKTFTLRFKPAGKQMMDEDTVPIGVPSFLPAEGGEAQHFYFMSMYLVGSKRSSQASSYAPNTFSMSTITDSSVFESSSSSSSIVDGLEMAHLLGRGSFGCVYYGTWYGTPVAVKVIDGDQLPVRCGKDIHTSSGSNKDIEATPPGTPHAEAVMAHELRHPYIVATLKYAVQQINRDRAPEYRDYQSHLQTLDDVSPACTPHSAAPRTPNGSAPPPRHYDSASTNVVSSTNAAPAASAMGWAVIEAPADAELDTAEDELLSGEVVARECRVKADAWNELDSNARGVSQGQNADFGRSSMGHQSATSSVLQQTWMVMEYCDKGCVQDAIDRGWLLSDRDCLNGQPNMTAVLATAIEIASALSYLHAQDVVHGDLSGWNVMLSSAGATSLLGRRGFVAKVADFGLSRSMDLRSRITTRNYGTITHMPPELLVKGIVSKAVDVYSFGVLLWQMITSSRPWSGLTHAQIIMKVANQKARLQWDKKVPSNYRELADACMAYEMSERPTFAQIVTRLEAMRDAANNGKVHEL